jgi:hypothetical protein
MLNIYVLVWSHPFGVVQSFGDMVAEGLRKNGAHVTIFTVNNPQFAETLFERIESSKVDFILSITLHSIYFKIDGDYLFKKIPTKYGIFFLDAPIYFTKEIGELAQYMPDDSILFFVDSNHTKQMRQYLDSYHSGKFVTAFFPHGGKSTQYDFIEKEDRSSDLIVFATLDDQISSSFSSSDNWLAVFPDLSQSPLAHHRNRIVELADNLIHGDYEIDLIEQLQAELVIEDLYATETSAALASTFDSFLKRYRRLHLIRGLIESTYAHQLKISFYGTGWERLGDLPENWKTFKPVHYDSQFELFNMSKCILNLDPNWAAGTHDRVFNAMSSNSLAITNYNNYTSIIFDDLSDCVTYKSINELPEKIEQAIENWDVIVPRGHRNFSMSHTWKNRCLSIVNLLR